MAASRRQPPIQRDVDELVEVVGPKAGATAGLSLIIILGAGLIVFLVVVVPWFLIYSLIHYSGNVGMRARYFPPVQKYLREFDRLHPALMSSVRDRVGPRRRNQGGKQSKLIYWPSEAAPGKWPLEEEDCLTPAILFAGLERAGWPRRAIWDLLRDQVEANEGAVSEEEKVEFARVRRIMVDHIVEEKLAGARRWLSWHPPKWVLELEQQGAPVSLSSPTVVEAKVESLDWILSRGQLVVPDPRNREKCVKRLTKLSQEFGMTWTTLEQANRLPGGKVEEYWQVLDAPPGEEVAEP